MEEKLPRIPIFVDSPLSVNATEVFRLHPECFNESIYEFLREKANPIARSAPSTPSTSPL